MKKSYLFFIFILLHTSFVGAVVVTLGGSEAAFQSNQPIQVIIVNNNGMTNEQTVYYDPNLGGVELNTEWAGPNASLYFPTLGTRYLWYNGYWVDQNGYYWNGGRHIYVEHPHWKTHWTGYWNTYNHPRWHHPEFSVHVREKFHEHHHH